MATTHSDTSVNSLVINKLTKAQYDALETKSETELYLVPDEIDNAPTSGSDNPVKSGGVYNALQGKQDALVSGTNIKTINNQSLLGSGNITIEGGSTYVPTLQSAPTSSTISYTKDGQTVDFEIGQFARVANQDNPTGYDMWQLYDLITENNVTTAAWRSMDSVIGDINTILDNINGEVV